jgi:hypothetical protein
MPERGLPKERAWERSPVLEPRASGPDPELVSDGGGLPFAPGALVGRPAPLDADDPAVASLLAYLTARCAPKRNARSLFKRDPVAPAAAPPTLDGWGLLARTDDEALFGRGRPPTLATVGVRSDPRRGSWSCYAESAGRPLRASRDGIRASSWRLDPTTELREDATTLRLLLTEQTFAGGKRAGDRVLTPDLHVGPDRLVLTLYVTPLPGFKTRSPNPETPVCVRLPEPIGPREVIDGALYERT